MSETIKGKLYFVFQIAGVNQNPISPTPFPKTRNRKPKT